MQKHIISTHAVMPAYVRYIRRKYILLIALTSLTAAVAAFALTQGAYTISLTGLIKSLLACESTAADIVIWDIRLPRIIAAIAGGWGLSIAGLAIQSLLKNPLGSPSTLGISHGAAFGAASAIVLFNGGFLSVTAFAFAGAVTATAAILFLARLKQLSPEAIILAGVALSSLFASATTLIQFLATETELSVVVFWTFGDVARSTWSETGAIIIAATAATLFLLIRRWELNALDTGHESACGLGVNADRIRLQGMVAAAVVAALITSFNGVIAFVGLIAPHIGRRMVGPDHRLLIPLSAVLGSLLLLSADTAGRVLVGSGSFPVGVVTSFLGAPMFLYLLIRGAAHT